MNEQAEGCECEQQVQLGDSEELGRVGWRISLEQNGGMDLQKYQCPSS